MDNDAIKTSMDRSWIRVITFCLKCSYIYEETSYYREEALNGCRTVNQLQTWLYGMNAVGELQNKDSNTGSLTESMDNDAIMTSVDKSWISVITSCLKCSINVTVKMDNEEVMQNCLLWQDHNWPHMHLNTARYKGCRQSHILTTVSSRYDANQV